MTEAQTQTSTAAPGEGASTQAPAQASADPRAASQSNLQSKSDPGTQAAAAATVDPNAPKAPYERPEGLSDDLWDDAAGVKFPDLLAKLNEANTLKAEQEARKASVPETADAYQLALPEGVTLPEGYALNPKDPILGPLREMAKAKGWTQADFSEAVSLEVKRVEANNAGIKEAIKARDASLGPNGAARVDALNKFFDATAPSPEVAKQLGQTLWTKDIIEYFEGVQKAVGSGGIGTPNRGGAPDAKKVGEIEGFDKMSFVEKRVHQMQNPSR